MMCSVEEIREENEKEVESQHKLRSGKRFGVRPEKIFSKTATISVPKLDTGSQTEDSDEKCEGESVSPRESGAHIALDMFNEAERALTLKIADVTRKTDEQQMILREEQDQYRDLENARERLRLEGDVIEKDVHELEIEQRSLRNRF